MTERKGRSHPTEAKPTGIRIEQDLIDRDYAETGVAAAKALRKAGLARVAFRMSPTKDAFLQSASQAARDNTAFTVLEAATEQDQFTWVNVVGYVDQRLVQTNFSGSAKDRVAQRKEERKRLVQEAVERVQALNLMGKEAPYNPADPTSKEEVLDLVIATAQGNVGKLILRRGRLQQRLDQPTTSAKREQLNQQLELTKSGLASAQERVDTLRARKNPSPQQ